VKVVAENLWDEDTSSELTTKLKRKKIIELELEDLRDHVERISFNIDKVYRHAKDQSRKEYNHAKQSFRRKLQNSYKKEKMRI